MTGALESHEQLFDQEQRASTVKTNRAPPGTHGFDHSGRRPVFAFSSRGCAPRTPKPRLREQLFLYEVLAASASSVFAPAPTSTSQPAVMAADKGSDADHGDQADVTAVHRCSVLCWFCV